MEEIKAVVFDMYGTVLYEEGGWEGRENFLAETASSHPGIKRKSFIAARRKQLDISLTGQTGSIEERYDKILNELGVDDGDDLSKRLARAERDLLDERVKTYPHIYGVINTLHRRGYRIGLLSNCTHPWEEIAGGLGAETYFDARVFSYRVGLVKPDPKIYLEICKLLRVEPRQAAFVGDGGDREMEGAKAVGMTTLMVEHEGAYCRNHQVEYSGLRIEGLMDLLEIFSRLK